MKIAIPDGLHKLGIDILKKAGFEVLPDFNPKDIDGIIVRSKTKITADFIQNAPELKVIARAGAGTDNIDKKEATRKNIVVLFEPLGNRNSTAEHAIALILALARKIPFFDSRMKNKEWLKKEEVEEIHGKTLGIIGVGRIGSLLAEKANALGMKILVFDTDKERLRELGFKNIDMETLFRKSDFVSIHVPGDAGNANLINKNFFCLMKPGAKLVNTSRGDIINEKDLIEALESGQLSGAALDVFSKEPPFSLPYFEKLKGMPNIILTPHKGPSKEAEQKTSINIAEQVVDYLKYGLIVNAVNAPYIDAARFQELKPYRQLIHNLSFFVSRLSDGKIQTIDVLYSGINAEETEIIDRIILSDILVSKFGRKKIGYLNAALVARQKRIKIRSRILTKEDESYQKLLEIKIATSQGKFKATGTLLGKRPKMVELNGRKIETDLLTKHILVIQNEDSPGAIGEIGTILGKMDINIESMVNIGENEKKEPALTIVNARLPENNGCQKLKSAIDKLRKNPKISEIKSIALP